ncbi:MAG: hypothetical protein HY706_14365 [Candidatus Hydrogenedentes bacterium]|nr:hypothetical protein [Candidatus Hydrogenedentota bacterium]
MYSKPARNCHILRKELRLHGSWNSSYGLTGGDDWTVTLNSMASGKLNLETLITHRIPLDNLPATVKMMRDRTGFFNKVMVKPHAQAG